MGMKENKIDWFVYLILFVFSFSAFFFAGYKFGNSHRNDELRKEVISSELIKEVRHSEDLLRKILQEQLEAQNKKDEEIEERLFYIVNGIGNLYASEKDTEKKKELEDLMIKTAKVNNFE